MLKEELVSSSLRLTEEIHNMFEFQMKLQQEILENQNKRDSQSAVKLPKLDITSFNGKKDVLVRILGCIRECCTYESRALGN